MLPTRLPMGWINQFFPTNGKPVSGHHRLNFNLLYFVPWRFGIDDSHNQKMLFLVTRFHGCPFAQPKLLRVQWSLSILRHGNSVE